ncbi:DUF4435 domain-containing protein [Burkholderia gladioli]|uniref:DUF4435 domain-containing protein n=1 Tax=Burkholderia gladioli TaxID=28095 RepID=UPI0016403824|nr:DUF4435 domain-containing protein [Burkholderia gladioli]
MDRADKMREDRKTPRTHQIKYLGLRSRVAVGSYIFVFEGIDDFPVYRTWMRYISNAIVYEPIEVKGKDNVLSLREFIRASAQNSADKTLFFIDRDFDDPGASKYAGWSDTYVTPAYSIENILVTPTVLDFLLIEDFGLTGENQGLRAPIIDHFTGLLDEFREAMLRVNSYLRWIRRESVACASFPKDAKSLISVDLSGVRKLYADDLREIAQSLELTSIPSDEVLKCHAEALASADLILSGRGKFVFDFFRRFIMALFADCRADTRRFFPSKRNPSEPTHDLMRKLAGFSTSPDCLRKFVAQHFDIAREATVPA